MASVAESGEKFGKLLGACPKDRLYHNLRNMSVQLDVLDDLHDHLEKELKSSAMVSLDLI